MSFRLADALAVAAAVGVVHRSSSLAGAAAAVAAAPQVVH